MTDTARFVDINTKPSGLRTLWPHLNGGVLRRASLVALILGSVLTLTNQAGAVFGEAEFQLLPMIQVCLTPFVVVAISQLLGARQAGVEAHGARSGKWAAETFLSTVISHGIPLRATLLALLAGGTNAATAAAVALLDRGNLNDLPLPLLAQAFSLPLVFGALSQALAYRRAARAFAFR